MANDLSDGLTISAIKSTVNDIAASVGKLRDKTDTIARDVNKLTSTLDDLRADFDKMVRDQAKTAVLQRAISELVRVRQEINQKYGGYATIRETMLGVLQATDAALVKKTTIAQVSEELMLSTPTYWLAPCLVAVSAWIANDRSLAERAIREAMKRDEEKTALAMALICRRSGRIDTGYEWLALYFAKQSAASITEETFTYIDAYVNGIFGPDTKHMCQGYVAKWINEVRGKDGGFEQSQETKWKNYCEKFREKTGGQYPLLNSSVAEFKMIDSCIGAIKSHQPICKKFQSIKDAFVDQDALRKAVDAELVRLVSHYDASEIAIRNEEEYLSLVKEYAGDEEKAKAEMAAREAERTQHKLDFIEQMSREITAETPSTPSKRRTAVTFLSGYINRGYNRYIDESKEAFPQKITITVDKWSGTSKDGTEQQQLLQEYEKQMKEARAREIRYAKSVRPQIFLILAVLLTAAAIVIGVMEPKALYPAGGALALGVILFICGLCAKKNTRKAVRRINGDYAERITAGKEKLSSILRQWQEAQAVVKSYHDMPGHDVVA